MEGTVFDIQRFSVHDGPGIRTTVFMKGCPLRCLWCHNPEGLTMAPQVQFFREACIGCRRCGGSKDFAAAAQCPAGALKQVGRAYSPPELLKKFWQTGTFTAVTAALPSPAANACCSRNL